MKTRRDVFQAIADPTRRDIIALLASQPLKLNDIAEKFEITRQAVSLHVKILLECGLIEIRQNGRERICEPKLEQLDQVTNWIEQYKTVWKHKFTALEKHLLNIQTKNQ